MAFFQILSLAAFAVVVRAGPPAIESYGHYAAAPLAYASPQVHYAPQVHHAPLHYAAPVAKAVHHAPLHYAAPVAKIATPVLQKTVVAEEYDPHPQYSYAYSIQDALTGDSKAHEEVRDGGVVKGSYSLVEPDGSIRTVTYTADSINGFNAVVDRTPPVHVKAVAPVAVKTVAQPLAYAKAVHAPIAYASPVAKAVHAPIHGYSGFH